MSPFKSTWHTDDTEQVSATRFSCPDWPDLLVGLVLFHATSTSFRNKQGVDSHSTEIKNTAVQSVSQDCYDVRTL